MESRKIIEPPEEYLFLEENLKTLSLPLNNADFQKTCFSIGEFIFIHPEMINEEAEDKNNAYLIALFYLTAAGDFPQAETLRAYCYQGILGQRGLAPQNSVKKILDTLTQDQKNELVQKVETYFQYIDETIEYLSSSYFQLMLGELCYQIGNIKKATEYIKKIEIGKIKINEKIWQSIPDETMINRSDLGELQSVLAFTMLDPKDRFHWLQKAVENGYRSEKVAFYYSIRRDLRRGTGNEKAIDYLYQDAKEGCDTHNCLNILERLAENKYSPRCLSSTANLALGKLYAGKGPVEDLPKAASYFFSAANQENAEAMLHLAAWYYDDQNDGRDTLRTIDLLKKAVALKEPQALIALETLAKQDPDAQLALAEYYLKGQGVVQDFHQAAKWFKAATDQGNAEAAWQLATLYIQGGMKLLNDKKEPNLLARPVFSQNYTHIVHLLEKALDGRCKKAYTTLHELAAIQNIHQAQLSLAKRYLSGSSKVQKDLNTAILFLKMAAKQNNIEAQCYYFATLCRHTPSDKKEIIQAATQLIHLAKTGYAPALSYLIENNSNLPEIECEIAKLYYYGTSMIEKNNRAAEKWFKKAADNKHAEAKGYLGAIYYNKFKHHQDPNDLSTSILFLKASVRDGCMKTRKFVGDLIKKSPPDVQDLLLPILLINITPLEQGPSIFVLPKSLPNLPAINDQLSFPIYKQKLKEILDSLIQSLDKQKQNPNVSMVKTVTKKWHLEEMQQKLSHVTTKDDLKKLIISALNDEFIIQHRDHKSFHLWKSKTESKLRELLDALTKNMKIDFKNDNTRLRD